MEKNVIFSIFMCARNTEDTLPHAIESVKIQTCKDWEMIIIDNGSTDGTWQLIQAAMEQDSRVKGIHLDQGVGWPKGASICMEYAVGEYMMFLAADDFFLGPGSLQAIKNALPEKPDMVFCGHASVQLAGNMYRIGGGIIPEKRMYTGEDKISDLFEIMGTLYYNSFFHFISLELLRKNGINFYEPFYADYEGVTEAICKASKIAVVNHAVYALTANTSQTAGTSTWKDYVMQWRSVRNTLVEKGRYSKEKLKYIAVRIFNNNMAILKSICFEEKVRDKEMNDMVVSYAERCRFLENLLNQKETVETFYFAGRQYYAEGIFEYMKHIYAQYRKLEAPAGIPLKTKWMDRLIEGLCVYDGEYYVNRTTFCKQDYEEVCAALADESNTGTFGYELAASMKEFVTEDTAYLWHTISETYINRMQKQIYELLFLAIEIKKRGRAAEVVEIVKESMEILQEIRAYLSEQQLGRITDDIKMVLGGV